MYLPSLLTPSALTRSGYGKSRAGAYPGCLPSPSMGTSHGRDSLSCWGFSIREAAL